MIGLESVDIIVKSDNKPALTSLIASWSTMRAMTSGSMMIIENSPVGSSKINGIVERAIQSVQGMIRTIRSDIEGRWGVKVDATHSIWPWIAEHAGFLLMRFELERDGKTACETLKGKSAKVHGMAWHSLKESFGRESERTAREADVHVGRRRKSSWEIETACGWRELFGNKTTKERWDRSHLEMVVAVPLRKNEDDPKMDGERLKSEVVVMDTEYRENLEAEEHVPVPKRVSISREILEEFGFTARCPGGMSLLRGTARLAHTENCRRRIEEEPKGTGKAHAATRRMKEYQDRAAEKGTKRTNADQEEGRQQHEHGEPTARMEEDAPTSSSSDSGDVTSMQSSNSSGSTMETSGREVGDGCKEAIKKRKAEEEHREDPERDDGKWMRTDGNKRKAGEESEESRLRNTVRYLKELDKIVS